MANPYTGFGIRAQVTPQSEPIPGSNQQLNNTGVGYSFVVDDMMHFIRFIILGASGGTYYVGERKLVKANLDALERLLKAERGLEVVTKIVEISEEGRAVSNDPALFALARCCACDVHPTQPLLKKDGSPVGKDRYIIHPDDIAVRQAAYAALHKVARTGTHLLHFLEYVKQFRGRGPLHDRAIEAWYQEKRAERVAFQVLKYQSRDGWSQRDVLRLARPKPVDSDHNAIYRWITKGWESAPETVPAEEALRQIWAFERVKHATDPNEIADLIVQHHLPREAVPTTALHSVKVWEALLEDMPLEAMTRNLATMTKEGVIKPMGEMTQKIVTRLRDREAIHKARVHPIKILAALTTYSGGHGIRGSNTWEPVREIIDALNDAFYLSFACVEPMGKRISIWIDVSGSMHGSCVNGIPNLQCHTAAAAMALVIANSELKMTENGLWIPLYYIGSFDTRAHPISISPTQRLDDVVRVIQQSGGGGTDCGVPFQWLKDQKIDVDCIVSISDSETWVGSAHPTQRLQVYRDFVGHPVRAVNIQMTATHVTNNDPTDMHALECIGFSTDTPNVISGFLRGEF